jgi:hypothetical protein
MRVVARKQLASEGRPPLNGIASSRSPGEVKRLGCTWKRPKHLWERDCSGRWKGLKLLKHHMSNPRWLDKSRALYRRACKRDPSRSPLSPAAGKVEVKKDAIRVTLRTIGGKVVYTATPVGGWRFELTYMESSSTPLLPQPRP